MTEVWVKTYEPDRAGQGHQEARVLRMVAHPGVTQLLDVVEQQDGSLELRLARLPGPDLGSLAPLTGDRAARLVAAVAATVADLHGVGVAHGRLDTRHVVLDRDEAPVLCGFGHAVLDADDQARRADVDGLIRMVGALLPEQSGSPSARRLRRALRRCRSADAVARRLAALAAQLPSSESAGSPRSPAHRSSRLPGVRWRPAWIAGVLLAASGAGWVMFGRSATPAGTVAARSCPAVDAGCRPLAAPGGMIEVAAGRFQAGAPGDVVVLGRWSCGSIPLPAVLRPSTGQVWVYDRWPAGSTPVPARLVGQVGAARSLQVVPGRCDRLQVVRADGSAVTMAPS